jgi:hypothetical protein
MRLPEDMGFMDLGAPNLSGQPHPETVISTEQVTHDVLFVPESGVAVNGLVGIGPNDERFTNDPHEARVFKGPHYAFGGEPRRITQTDGGDPDQPPRNDITHTPHTDEDKQGEQ